MFICQLFYCQQARGYLSVSLPGFVNYPWRGFYGTSYLFVSFALTGQQLTPENFQALRGAGFSLDFYAAYVVIFQTSCALIWFLIGVVIFWRKSDNWMALFVALFLVTYAATVSATVDPLATFSSGVFPTIQLGLSPFSPLPWNILFFGFVGSMLFAQVYRYRRVSDSVQRRQTKWIILGVSFSLPGFVAILILSTFAQAHSATGTHPFFYGGIIGYLCQLLIPLSIAIAVLRSQLFDIDVLIKRTLVYGALTVCVVVTYITLVIGLGTVFHSSENIFLSLFATALVAVLFQPLREKMTLLFFQQFVPGRVDTCSKIRIKRN